MENQEEKHEKEFSAITYSVTCKYYVDFLR